MDELKIFTGNAHPELAEAVCQHLALPLGKAEVFEFPNENIFVRIMENVRSCDVFVLQPICSPVSKSLVELLIMLDAFKRASAGRITAVVPYYGYGRTDKKDQPRVPITARLVADLITVAGAHRMLTLDLHAGQIQGFFNIPVDELTAFYLQSHYFRLKHLTNPVVVAADVGISKRARDFAARLKSPLAIIEKRRNERTAGVEIFNVIGEVKAKQAVIFDDEIDTGSSMVKAVDAVLSAGATEISACCTHPILSQDATQRLAQSPLKELVVTDSVPVPLSKRLENMTILPIAPLLGEAIARIHIGRSVGAMFEEAEKGNNEVAGQSA